MIRRYLMAALAMLLCGQPAQASTLPAYVVASPAGGAVLRVLTSADQCPVARYRDDAAQIRELAKADETNFVTAHFPFAAVVQKDGKLAIGSVAIGDAFGAAERVPELPGVMAILAGHTHFLQVSVPRGGPVQIVNGFSGTLEDTPSAPANLAEARLMGTSPALADVTTRSFVFGFGLLERRGNGGWRYSAFDQNGKLLLRKAIRRIP